MPHALETLALFPTGLSPRPAELEIHDHCEGKLWMAAYFPDLPLEALTDPNADQPTVVADLQNGHKRIVAANLKAIGYGIRPNLKLSAAFALSDSLEVLERCEKSERTKLEALAEQVKQLTPVVSLEPPAALLLEIGGSLKLFGGIDAIKAASMTLLRKARVTSHLSVAPTALAALWLARCGQEDILSRETLMGRLSQIPIEATGWPEKVRGLLKSMGVRTLGECMRLPRDGFARRIGLRHLQELDKSRGDHDLRQEFEPALQLTAHSELTHETVSTTLLADVGKQLIRHLVEDLRKRQLRIPGFECVFHHLNHTATLECLRFAEPTGDEERFIRLFLDRLEQIRLIAPVIGLSLKAEPAEPAIASDGALFESAGEAAVVSVRSSLIERLRSRFGMNSLYGMDLVDEHRPEAAWSKSRQFSQRKRRPPLIAGDAQQRPLWLLPMPRRLPATVGNLPCYQSREPLRITRGPERIESGWWDGGEIGRDYYVAVSTHGEKLWVFQDRRASGDWYLHGFFA